MNRWVRLRVFGFAVVTVIIVGVFTAGVVVIVSEPPGIINRLKSGPALLTLLAVSTVVSLPLTALGGILGGLLAARIVNKPSPPPPLWTLVIRGFFLGLGSGACVGAAFYAIPSGITGQLGLVMMMSLVGALSGACSGSIIGAYCHCTIRRHHERAAQHAH